MMLFTIKWKVTPSNGAHNPTRKNVACSCVLDFKTGMIGLHFNNSSRLQHNYGLVDLSVF
jgi:hypothetical protein